ncbi:Formate/nitrite transporter [Penicillium argentinense]|uniref:Formate/nitrite transporter n=1 Tax=Penicillium argentinense TaxID=1131581 RepID=A0A9W9G2M1_9EURO|nr:Formate/nitrite transporter [Penicillium argentinense]KAJ5110525.1 Formate/nitrite transporter [Penicillium argentinense]
MAVDALSPFEVVEAVAKAGVQKGNMSLPKVFFSSVSAGCLLAFACGTVLSTNATPWFQENAPGLIRTIAALVFPYGLCMIILTGADLYGEVFATEPFKSAVTTFATKKQVTPDFHMIFLRGIGCNWLVCLGCFFGLQGRDLASKIIGIWFPIFAFVSLGFDHVVANMTFIPLGIWLGTPGINVGLYIWKGIIPTLIGNILGGGLFCGMSEVTTVVIL